MRSFSNIMPNFADKLHLLVDSIKNRHRETFYKFCSKNLEERKIIRTFAPAFERECFSDTFKGTEEVWVSG